jgi:hypothetical protein
MAFTRIAVIGSTAIAFAVTLTVAGVEWLDTGRVLRLS